MRKYVYENGTVYISAPTEEQIHNIRESTKLFLTRLAERGLFDDRYKRNNTTAGKTNIKTRRKNKWIKRSDRSYVQAYRSIWGIH